MYPPSHNSRAGGADPKARSQLTSCYDPVATHTRMPPRAPLTPPTTRSHHYSLRTPNFKRNPLNTKTLNVKPQNVKPVAHDTPAAQQPTPVAPTVEEIEKQEAMETMLESLRGMGVCRHCDSPSLVVTREQHHVCTACGRVNDYAHDYSGFLQKAMQDSYERISHYNERVAQWFLVDPPVPDEIYELIEDKAFDPDSPAWEDLTKEDFRHICRSIELKDDMKEQFRSKKFKQRRLENLNRYVERWCSLKYRLCGVKPATVDANTLAKLREKFIQLQMPFERIRHKPDCDGRRKCHKHFKCRHNFPNFNFTFIKLLKILFEDDKLVEEHFLPVFPQLKTKSKVRQLEEMWSKLMHFVGWGQVYTVQTARQKLVEKMGENFTQRVQASLKKKNIYL
jgi:hypothetical protein